MTNNFDELIRELSAQAYSGQIKQVHAAIEQLEDLTAAAEIGVRNLWAKWRQAASEPIGLERLSVLARCSVLRRLLREARHTAHTLQSALRIAQGGVYFDLTTAAASRGMSHREIHEALVSALVEENGNYFYYPIDVYDDYFIYERTDPTKTTDYSGATALYRRDYAISVDETVTLGDPAEVEKKIQYVDAVRIESGGAVHFLHQVK